MLPTDAEVRKIQHGKTHNLAIGAVTWGDIEVWYGRKLNGIPVEGTQLLLAIGAHGDPIEYITNWRNYEPYAEMPIKSPESAFEDLKIKGVPTGMIKPERISINEMYLAYRTKPGAETEDYLEPVWIFKGEVILNDKSVMPVNGYVPALTEDSIKDLSLP